MINLDELEKRLDLRREFGEGLSYTTAKTLIERVRVLEAEKAQKQLSIDDLRKQLQALETDNDRFYEKVNDERTGNTVFDLLRKAEVERDEMFKIANSWQRATENCEARLGKLERVRKAAAILDRSTELPMFPELRTALADLEIGQL